MAGLSVPSSRLMVIAAALLFSTGGVAIKATSLTGWQTAAARSLVAAIALLLVIPASRKGWSWRILPAATAYAATLISFVLANKLTTSANTIFLQSTAPAYLLVLGPVVLHERVRRSDIWLTVALVLGMIFLLMGTAPPIRTAPNPPLGNLLAAISGFTYALTLTGLRWLSRQHSENAALATVAVGNVLVFVLAAPLAWPVVQRDIGDLAVILYLGCIQIAAAYWLLTRGMRAISAFETAAFLLVEPVLNPFWSWLGHGERPTIWSLAGGIVILSAAALRIRFARDGEGATA